MVLIPQNTLLTKTLLLQERRLQTMKSCSKPYSVLLFEKEIIIFPNVFHPATDTKLLISSIKVDSNDSILELCAGTGAISLFLAEKAKDVLATDINPTAIENITANIQRYHLEEKMEARQTDIFPKTDAQFDIIVVNPPYTDKEANDVIEMSVWDKDNKVIKRIISEGRKYLTASGKMYISWANFANFAFFENLARKENYKIKIIAETSKEEHTYRVYELTFSQKKWGCEDKRVEM